MNKGKASMDIDGIRREAEVACDHKWIAAINEELAKRGIDVRWAFAAFPVQPTIAELCELLKPMPKPKKPRGVAKLPEQPDWLKRSLAGIQDARHYSVILEGINFAVIKSRGGYWYDNSGKHYGAVSYDLVDKRAQNTNDYLRTNKTLKTGGRVSGAELEAWKKEIEARDSELAPT
jgi:hypothetical protein